MGIFAGEDIIVFMCSVRFRFTNHKRGKGDWGFFFGEGAMVGHTAGMWPRLLFLYPRGLAAWPGVKKSMFIRADGSVLYESGPECKNYLCDF